MPAKRQTTLNMFKAEPAACGSAQQSKQKRSFSEADESTTTVSAPAKKARNTTAATKSKARAEAPEIKSNLVDSLRPGLMLVMIGLNPGLETAAKGHAYAHPSNLYWKLLHWSGITPRLHPPSDTHSLPDLYKIGNTNICLRPSRTGAELSKAEMLEGAKTLDAKVAHYKPEAVCIVGKSIWETIYKFKTGSTLKGTDFHYGWQDEKLWLGRPVERAARAEWAGSRTFVATTTSALAKSMSNEQKLEIWKPLGEWVKQKRGDAVGGDGDEAEKGGDEKSEDEQ